MPARRAFIAGALGVLGGSLVAEAQPARVYQVGVIIQGGSAYYHAVDGLRDGLRELGLEDGKQLVLHVRDAKGDLKAVEASARGLEAEHVDLIYAWSTSTSLAVMRATKKVPSVFYAGSDPVASGLVTNFRKPGGRITGMHGWTTDLTAKRLELLKEMLPKLRRVVTYYNPENSAAQQAVKLAREAARQLKVELVEHRVASVEELRASLGALRPGEADAYLALSDAMLTSQAALVIETTTAKRIPTMFQDRQTVTQGGLASYGVDYYVVGRFSAKQVQRVLLGANPGDLPVVQLERIPFVVNVKTAKALGLTLPRSILERADEIIE
jgi:putative ABC transport system substrate-binding protein